MSQIPKRVGIVGSGVTGLAAASFLHKNNVDIILLEKDNHVGGHCYSVPSPDIPLNNLDTNSKKSLYIPSCDLGFMVMSPITYPEFIQWLKEHNVEIESTDMSFSSSTPDGIEWSSNNPFADIKNLFKIDIWKMLWDFMRFEAISYYELSRNYINYNETILEFKNKYHFSDAFMKYFLNPQLGSIWSTPSEDVYDMPLEFILTFMKKHQLFSLWGRPNWLTIKNRSYNYVNKVIKPFENKIYTGKSGEVIRLLFNSNNNKNNNIIIETADNKQHIVDHVLFVCQPKLALNILNNSNHGPSDEEYNILSKFDCNDNDVILHSDDTIVAKNKSLWAGWNYHTSVDNQVNVTYWLNILQNLKFDNNNNNNKIDNLFATLNPLENKQPDPNKVYHKWTTQHPKYTVESWKIIKNNELDNIQCKRGLSFAGAWTGYGFHRDGFLSGMKESHKIINKTYKINNVNINKSSSYWFSWICWNIDHYILQFVIILLNLLFFKFLNKQR